jgi:diaminopimelate epimerase
MDIHFTKMHGLGNDFVIIEAQYLPPQVNLSRLAAFLSDRHFGVGADGLIVIAPATDPERFDTQFLFFNSDGSRAEMCGNGIRCFARYVYDHKILQTETFRVETLAGLIQPTINPDQTVTVNMGPPKLKPAEIPFKGYLDDPITYAVKAFPITVEGKILPVTLVNMGNPHCVIFQEDLESPADPAVFGPLLEVHPYFPEKTNVEFVTVESPQKLRVTVWERGCGFTLACGTGACATAVAGHLLEKTGDQVEVELPGGSLQISWALNQGRDVFMSGPATYVFEGTISIDEKTFFSPDVLQQETSFLS